MASIVKVDQIQNADGTVEYLNAGSIKNASLHSSVTGGSGITALGTVASGTLNSSVNINSALSSATFPAGHIIQIKGKHDSTQDAFSVGTLPVKLPLNISITPTSTTNTIIIHGCLFCGNTNFNGGIGMMRHLSSVTLNSTYMTANDSSIPRIANAGGSDGLYVRAGNFYNADDPLGSVHTLDFVPFTYYDSSYSTTSGSDLNPITYTLYGEASTTQTYYYNRASTATTSGHGTSFIYAYEVMGSIT